MKTTILLALAVATIYTLPSLGQSGNATRLETADRTISVDGIRYKTIQECIDAVAARASSGTTCFVPDGTQNTSQVEMASGVKLVFAGGRFVNSGTHGGVFIYFGPNVSNATVCGRGMNATYLLNASTGTQFGAVIQDHGTDDTVCDLTADGNGNSTSTMVHQQATRPKVHGVRLIADMVHVENHSYAWDIRGGSDFDVSNLEAQGGSSDAIQLSTRDFTATYGDVKGGHFSNIYAHNSPRNGLDFDANGNALAISGTTWSNVRLANNGTADDGTDDEYGLALFAPPAGGCVISDNTFINLVAAGNKGSGILLKGNIIRNTLLGIISQNNGTGRVGTVGRDSIQLISATEAVPANNWIEAYARHTGNNRAFSTDASTRENSFLLNLGNDPTSFGSSNDYYNLMTPTRTTH
jgi:hypothetical protein